MALNTTIQVGDGALTPYALQEAIGAYTDEAYTDARKLSGTELVSGNPNIEVDGETYIGQMRWFKPLNPEINTASLTNRADGTKTTYGSEYLRYVKTVRTHGAEKVNLSKVISQKDGLAKVGRDFGQTRSLDEHNSILAVLRGVMVSEVLYGLGEAGGGTGNGGQTFNNDPEDKTYGFYVDLGANTVIATAAAATQGAQRAEAILNAFGMAYKDYEPEYAYLVTSPEVMASFRSANLVDQDRVTDGNMDFQTIFNGKFRLISTRATQGLSATEITKLNSHATAAPQLQANAKTTFLVLPGSVAMVDIPIEEDVEIDRKAAAFQGGGTTEIWYRWGYVAHPAGYNWTGAEDAFPNRADYQAAKQGATPGLVTALTTGLVGATGVWERKAQSALSLGILPIFHN